MVHPKKRKSSKRKKQPPQHDGSTLYEPEQQIESNPTTSIDDDLSRSPLSEVEDYAIIMLDSKGTIMSWNKGAEKIKGYSSDEIIGKNYRIFYTEEDKEINLAGRLLEEARTKGRTKYEGWRVKKNGIRFWGNVSLTAIHDIHNTVYGFIKITSDLTEKKSVEDSHSNFIEELKHKNAALKQSEERYHKMVTEVVDYAIILLDQHGIILDWNKGAEKVKGYSASEIIGQSFRLFYPKEEKDSGLPETLLSEATKRGSITHEGWRIRKDGTRFWGFITLTALHDDLGNLLGFSKVTRDLTDKKIADDKVSVAMEELRQANEHLLQSEERYHKMIAEVKDYAIILLDESGNIQNWNTGAELIKGYQTNEIVGKNFRLFYSDEDRKRKLPDSLLEQARIKGSAAHEGWRIRKDGTRFWGSIVITALHNKDGDVIGFSKVTRDLTDKRHAEELLKTTAAQLDLKNKMLERVNADLSSFTHVASHDLKEPLRKIKAFASKIEREGGDLEKSQVYLDKIQASVGRMENLINDLLSYSEVSNDSSTSQPVDLNEVLQQVTNDLEIAINEKGAIIKADRLPTIIGVRFQLNQLFLNLLSNAIKFSKTGEAPRIRIKAKQVRGPDIPGFASSGKSPYYQITIKDNGIGFEQQKKDQIFHPFQRLVSKDAIAGTGLGLSIVKRIVENHNGIVTAEGQPGVGATFHLYLPAGETS